MEDGDGCDGDVVVRIILVVTAFKGDGSGGDGYGCNVMMMVILMNVM